MKAIIFGASGQDGYYLTRLLEHQQIQVIGVSRNGNHLRGSAGDFSFVEAQIKKYQPNYVFHFAASSTTRHDALFENHESVSTGTINILEAVYRHSRHSKVFLSGSAMQFENSGAAIDENTPFAALSPYAVSRIHSIYAGRYYRALGLKVYVGYFFNHDSPRRSVQHVNQKIAVAARTGERIEIGDISVRKEFNFAGDTVEAVWILVNQMQVYEAVVGSGEAHSIEDWLDKCFRSVNKNWRDYVTIKKDFKPEYRVLVSNPVLIKSLGWQPKVDIEQLAKMMVGE